MYFWIKDMYSHTLKDAGDRIFYFGFLKWILFYLPISLQAIFLFCYAAGHAILLSSGFSNLLAFRTSSDLNEVSNNLGSIKIIFISSLLLSIQYLLLQTNFFERKSLNIAAKFMAWLSSILFLKLLVENILYSLSIQTSTGLTFSYNNDYLWLLSVLLTLTLIIVKGAWIYNTDRNSLKYLALTSRILSSYSLFIIILALPMIIYAIIKNIL